MNLSIFWYSIHKRWRSLNKTPRNVGQPHFLILILLSEWTILCEIFVKIFSQIEHEFFDHVNTKKSIKFCTKTNKRTFPFQTFLLWYRQIMVPPKLWAAEFNAWDWVTFFPEILITGYVKVTAFIFHIHHTALAKQTTVVCYPDSVNVG